MDGRIDGSVRDPGQWFALLLECFAVDHRCLAQLSDALQPAPVATIFAIRASVSALVEETSVPASNRFLGSSIRSLFDAARANAALPHSFSLVSFR